MEYALNFIYDGGDNATYLHKNYYQALKEKEASIKELLEDYAEMGYLVKVVEDTNDDTTILCTTLEENIPYYIRVVISRIYE